tara:strand:+ start:6627 stop:7142 length:516 start_codon:yes stop_codon:yes gene_type:complete
MKTLVKVLTLKLEADKVVRALPERAKKTLRRYLRMLEEGIIGRGEKPQVQVIPKEEPIYVKPKKRGGFSPKAINLDSMSKNWKHSKEECELEIIRFLKLLDTEVGDRERGMRKIYCIGDIKWMKEEYPHIYVKQMKRAYGRLHSTDYKKKLANGGAVGRWRSSFIPQSQKQ